MLRIVMCGIVGSVVGIIVFLDGPAELALADLVGAAEAYLAGGTIGGICAAMLNGLANGPIRSDRHDPKRSVPSDRWCPRRARDDRQVM